MGVALAYDVIGSDVKELIKKVKEIAGKVKVRSQSPASEN
jgi:hypothetical protein